MTSEIEDKILSLYALGNSYSQISQAIEDFYGVGFSKATVSAVTDKIIPMLNEWKIRPLEEVYPFVFLDVPWKKCPFDAIHYKVKEDGKYISKAFYTVLSLRVDGKKEILGLLTSNLFSRYLTIGKIGYLSLRYPLLLKEQKLEF